MDSQLSDNGQSVPKDRSSFGSWEAAIDGKKIAQEEAEAVGRTSQRSAKTEKITRNAARQLRGEDQPKTMAVA